MRRGFTLVEMLVATALVMLMMLLFAEIFGAAIGTITAQKGLANNDQKARAYVTVLTHDLNNRSYRASNARGATKELMPLTIPGLIESPRGIVPLTTGDVVDEANQRGFLYISENDVDDDTDDVLHFTVLIPPTSGDNMPTRFYGRAKALGGANDNNQPDRDDGIQDDNASSSPAAEVMYFMRGRNLYRKVLLLRQPMSNIPTFDAQPSQGIRGAGNSFNEFENPYSNFGTTSFSHDWDFSGTRIVAQDDGDGNPEVEGTDTYRFHFHGLEALDNARGSSGFPLGIPWNRTGFYSRFGVNRPVEYLTDSGGNPVAFIGRFTYEETSDNAFGWPGVEEGATDNMMTRTDLIAAPDGAVAIDVNTNNTFDLGLDQVLQGDRTGEDIVLTNVEAFNIEVWDPNFFETDTDGSGAWDPYDPDDDVNLNGIQDNGAWIDLGHNYATNVGLYRAGARNITNYGPSTPARNHVYDTWHPEAGIDTSGNGSIETGERTKPPFRPLQVTADGARLQRSSLMGVTEDFINPNGMLDAGEDLNGNGVLDQNVFYYPDRAEDQNGNGTADTGEDVNNDGNFDQGTRNDSIGYVVVQVDSPGLTGAKPPEWTRQPGVPVRDGDVVWQCFDNRIGLERIRITVRYRDVSTGQARQVTLVHSLVD